jgi:ABC-type multidrug transport system fused ATPase/permease subunit
MTRSKPSGQPRDRGTLSRLAGVLAGRDRWRLGAVAACAVVSSAFVLAGPLLLGDATNIVFNGITGGRLHPGITKAQEVASLRAHGQGHLADMLSAMDVVPGVGVDFIRLGIVLGLAALAYVLAAASQWAQGYIMAGVAMRTVHGLRQAVEEKLARLPLSYFDSHPHGEILGRVTTDIDNISTTVQEAVSPLLTSVLTVLGLLGAMFWLSPLLAVVSVVVIPLAMLLMAVIAGRSRAQFTAAWSQVGKLNGLVEETHTGHSLVLAFGRRQATAEAFDQQNQELYEASFRAQFLSGLILPIVQFVANLNYVFVAALGGWQVANGAITFGAVQAFIQYSRRFLIPVGQIASQINVLQSGLVSGARLFEFMDEPQETVTAGTGAAAPPTVVAALAAAGHRVQLEHVSFRYNPATPLIEDFTLDVAPGQTVAIVGPTGAGKTTIVNLLMRFYEIQSGRILLDGVDYWELSRDQTRSCFGMVLQDTWLFGGTVRDNIAYGKDGATDEEIIAAAEAAHVDHFARTLPDGYATVLAGDAAGISSGQKQLLTIARAFLANPGILILDEATSNVDTRTEALIQDAMARLQSGRTTFVIAHRLSTIRNADTIVVMDQGQIVEQGNHQELLDHRGLYYDLYNSQFTEAPTA